MKRNCFDCYYFKSISFLDEPCDFCQNNPKIKALNCKTNPLNHFNKSMSKTIEIPKDSKVTSIEYDDNRIIINIEPID